MGRLAASGGAQLAATTPASAGLVLNSLAYQVLLIGEACLSGAHKRYQTAPGRQSLEKTDFLREHLNTLKKIARIG